MINLFFAKTEPGKRRISVVPDEGAQEGKPQKRATRMGDHKLSIIQTRASILGISQDGSTDNEQENEKLGGKASAGILLSPGGADSTTLIISFFK